MPEHSSDTKLDMILAEQRRQGRKIDMVCDWINGTNATEGAKVRVARLEQTYKTIQWIGRTTIGAIVVAAVSAAWAFFRGGGGGGP